MWAPIFQQNKKNVLKVLQHYIDHLQNFKDVIEKDDTKEIYSLIHDANDIKRVLDQKDEQ